MGDSRSREQRILQLPRRRQTPQPQSKNIKRRNPEPQARNPTLPDVCYPPAVPQPQPESETRTWKAEAKPNPETRDPKSQNRNRNPKTQDQEPETEPRNPKHENPKHENPGSETRSSKQVLTAAFPGKIPIDVEVTQPATQFHLQGYLTYKKMHPLRTLPWAYA